MKQQPSTQGANTQLTKQMTLPQRVLDSAAKGLEGFWKLAERLRQEPTLVARPADGVWSGWCYLPVNVVAGIIAHLVKDYMTEDEVEKNLVLKTRLLTAVSAWRMTKGVYVFDPDVLRALTESEVDEDFPDELFMRLPDWCPYISTPGFKIKEGVFIHGFFAYVDDRSWANSRGYPPELNFEILVDPKLCSSEQLPLAAICDATVQGLLSDDVHRGLAQEKILERAAELGRTQEYLQMHTNVPLGKGAFSKAFHDQNMKLGSWYSSVAKIMEMDEALGDEVNNFFGQLQAKLASLLLYLVSEKADIAPEFDQMEIRNRIASNDRRGIRNFQASGIRAWEVGYRIGAEIRAFEEKEASVVSEGGGSGKRPHVRKAHWHAFWTGPRDQPSERKRVVHWLPPIPVKVSGSDDLVPTMHKVAGTAPQARQ